MAPLFNTTAVCVTTEACAHALDVAQERLDDFQRLSYIFASLFGTARLYQGRPIFTGKGRHPDARSGEPPRYPEPEFVIGSDDEDDDAPHTMEASKSTLPDPSHFREVNVDGETFHVVRSDEDVTRLENTRVFRGAGDERELAQRCVEEAQPTSSSSPVLPGRSQSARNERRRQGSPVSRIGTAVSM